MWGSGLGAGKHRNFKDWLDIVNARSVNKIHKLQTTALTILLSLIRTVSAVINGVAQLVAVDATVVGAAKAERSLTLDVHCG